MDLFDLESFRELPSPSESEIMSMWKGSLDVPLVSIICIAFNHELHLHDAMKGFLIQQSDYPFEIIIHDDVSTDDTQQIIKYYQDKYPKIVRSIIQIENQFSQDPNRVISIPLKAATGKYVALCEGDDFWIEPLKLQRQVCYLDKNTGFSMCIHNAVVCNLYHGTQRLFNSKEMPAVIGIKDVILRGWFSPTASFLFRKNSINMPVNENINGDMLLLFLNALRGKIYYSNEVMSVYNYGTLGSLSHSSKGNKIKLYQKKWNLLTFINEKTKNRYLLFTSWALFKSKVGYLLNCLGLR